jgi:glucose/arabinose dehydrogenase
VKTISRRGLINKVLGLCLATVCATACGAAPPFSVDVLADFHQPWAMVFLPDGRLLVTEKRGQIKVRDANGGISEVGGLPQVAYGGQGGLGDIALHPRFEENRLLYFSYAERGEGGRGAAVARARLVSTTSGDRLENLEVIWRQLPKVGGQGHYGHRIAFGPGGYLWISSGERQKFEPAQDLRSGLGKIIRLTDSGAPPEDNPFAAQGGRAAEVWSLGHRNPLGLAFDDSGRLWVAEMGPAGGDELNLVVRGGNYGYPEVSEGDHYNGTPIPDHHTRPEFTAPVIAWSPVISPSVVSLQKAWCGSRSPAIRRGKWSACPSGRASARSSRDPTARCGYSRTRSAAHAAACCGSAGPLPEPRARIHPGGQGAGIY